MSHQSNGELQPPSTLRIWFSRRFTLNFLSTVPKLVNLALIVFRITLRRNQVRPSRTFPMCWQDDPAPVTWTCGHTTNEPLQSRVIWCPAADRRGSVCATLQRASKASSRNRRFACPSCRKKGPGGGKDDKGSGGSKGSTSATAGSSVAVGA